MTPIQQLMLGVGAKKKTYMDDVFSTYLYTGTGSTLSINNGVDLTEGGLVWTKRRDGASNHQLFDTARGTGKTIYTDGNWAEWAYSTTLTAYNNNGFTLGSYSGLNGNGNDYSSWTFRKAPGFFDVVTYTGNGTLNRTVNHSLGSAPGFIMIKRLDGTDGWIVSHKNDWSKISQLTSAAFFTGAQFQSITPTSTQFTLGNGDAENGNGYSYVAYVFAGGESTAATARSVDFDGNGDMIYVPDDDAWDIGSVDCTLECWVNFRTHNGHDGIFHNVNNSNWNGGGWIMEPVSGVFNFYYHNASTTGNVVGAAIPLGQWQHIAVTKSGSTIKIYQDGILTGSGTISGTIRDGTNSLKIGGQCVGTDCDALISNVRITIGQILYTSAFKPSTVPLTTTSQGATASNVKLLCCNNSSITGSTVTAGIINSFGSPTASIDSPFDDPAAFIFGNNEDQNVIKCGSYKGQSSHSTRLEVNLGFEPQLVLIKNVDSTKDWVILDSMRRWEGDADDQNVSWLRANTSDPEGNGQMAAITPTGFICQSSSFVNGNSDDFIYMAIRRPDGYVGKPQLATNVFNMVAGTSNADIPEFVSGFPVDFALFRPVASTNDFLATTRLTQGGTLDTNNTDAEIGSGDSTFDFSNGWGSWTADLSSYQSWMWKRHAGFDVVTYEGDGTAGHQISHSLSKVPEMIWVKRRDSTRTWGVYHKGLNGGTNPEQYALYLDTNYANGGTSQWNSTAPTSTHFSLGTSSTSNNNSGSYIAMLFASVNGISKLGYYDGSSSAQTITTGFQPRFLIVKCITHSGNWITIDTTNGWTGSNSDKFLMLNSTSANNTYKYATPTSTGFTVIQDNINLEINGSGRKWIYYAHA